jgi:hypothetical protein
MEMCRVCLFLFYRDAAAAPLANKHTSCLFYAVAAFGEGSLGSMVNYLSENNI